MISSIKLILYFHKATKLLSRRINLHHLISDISESLSDVFSQLVKARPYQISILLAQLISKVVQSLLAGKLVVHHSTKLFFFKILKKEQKENRKINLC